MPPSTPGSETKEPAREAPAKEAHVHARISQPNAVGTQGTSQPPRRAWQCLQPQFYEGAGLLPDGRVAWKVSMKTLLTGQSEQGVETSQHTASVVGLCFSSSPSLPHSLSPPLPHT